MKLALIFITSFLLLQGHALAQAPACTGQGAATNFANNCASCHGKTGGGTGTTYKPPARIFNDTGASSSSPGASWINNPPSVASIISSADQGINNIDPTMPAWDTVLCPSDISDIANYIMSTFVGPSAQSCSIDGQQGLAFNACQCPPNYSVYQIPSSTLQVCRPNPPSYLNASTSVSDYFSDPSTTTANSGYPICGSGRIAVSSTGAVLNISSSAEPNSTLTVPMLKPNPDGFAAYPFATQGPNGPLYLYGAGFRCACGNPPAGAASSSPAKQISTVPSDVFSVISAPIPASPYSQVAIAMDGHSDGRMGSIFKLGNATGGAYCGCPNFNEQPVASDSTNTGIVCQPMLGTTSNGKFTLDPHAVLVAYNPSSITNGSQVIVSNETHNSAGNVITSVALPVALGSALTKPYQRRIWTCATGFALNPMAGNTCLPIAAAANACDDGSISEVASAVSSKISGSTPATKFDNVVNKKLACCMNEFTPGLKNLKYDCIDNSTTSYTSFDSLWTSADPPVTLPPPQCSSGGNCTVINGGATGAQLNAIVLSNAAGAHISGFYNLKGSRCNQYSEFGPSGLQPISLNLKTGAYTSIGNTLNAPTPPTGNPLNFGFDVPPLTPAGAGACPILVRAAMIATCPPNPTSAPASAIMPTLYNETVFTNPLSASTTAAVSTVRCTAASKIQIHIRVEQLTQIVGQAPIKTVDTILNPNQAANISVSSIVNGKNGGACPDGTTKVGASCVSQ